MKKTNPIPLPEAFSKRLQRQLPEHAGEILRALDTESVTAVHLNPRKPAPLFAEAPAVKWNTNGRYIDNTHSFALDPFWHAGAYYAMEPASQVIANITQQVIERQRISLALDLCAAPGGKSAVLRSVLPDDTVLVSNEIHRKRAEILLENMTKWGHPSQLVTSAEPEQLATSGIQFDLILVDAPCSGEGMFRKDHNARSEWSPENVNMCALRQQDILDAADRMLRPGGTLIYSTCTFAEDENDLQVSRLADRGWEVLELSVTAALKTRTGLQFAPGITQSEGLFVAALRKPDTTDDRASKITSRSSPNALFSGKPLTGKEELPFGLPEGEPVYHIGNHLRYLPQRLHEPLASLQQSRIQVLKAGTALYSARGKHWVPAHEWAMATSTALPEAAVDLNREQALNYLRGHAGREDFGKGWKLACYEKQPLGWLKAVGNRWNNHYPLHWKLRS